MRGAVDAVPPFRRWADRARYTAAAAIGAGILKYIFNAITAESAFIGANSGVA